MNPIEALIQIARKVEYEDEPTLRSLATLARSGLRSSGSHRILTSDHQTDRWLYVCCCGWSASVVPLRQGETYEFGGHLTDFKGRGL